MTFPVAAGFCNKLSAAMTSTTGRVTGKRVLVTGASRGMGRSRAVRLAEEGADLIFVDICESLPEVEYPLGSPEELEERARLIEKHGRRAITYVVDVNLTGTWNTCAAALPHLAELGGSLVNISSAAGLKGTRLHTPYTASKHDVVGLRTSSSAERS